MDYDVMYIDGRNAVHDHRTQGGSRPGSRPTAVVVPPSSRPTVIQTAVPPPSAGYYQPGPTGYQPVGFYPQPPFASRFGMTTGELIDTAIQILAAIQPLPAAPTAQGEAQIDVENLVTYQGALWQHAKRDEQLRTLGSLLVRILK